MLHWYDGVIPCPAQAYCERNEGETQCMRKNGPAEAGIEGADAVRAGAAGVARRQIS